MICPDLSPCGDCVTSSVTCLFACPHAARLAMGRRALTEIGPVAWVAGVVDSAPLMTVTAVPDTDFTRSRSESIVSTKPAMTGAVAASEIVMTSTVPDTGAVAIGAERVAENGEPARDEDVRRSGIGPRPGRRVPDLIARLDVLCPVEIPRLGDMLPCCGRLTERDARGSHPMRAERQRWRQLASTIADMSDHSGVGGIVVCPAVQVKSPGARSPGCRNADVCRIWRAGARPGNSSPCRSSGNQRRGTDACPR